MCGDPDPSEAVTTPRSSGSLESWPVYHELAREVARSATKARLWALAEEADRIAEAFTFWEHADPGPDLRRAAIARLLDMRAKVANL